MVSSILFALLAAQPAQLPTADSFVGRLSFEAHSVNREGAEDVVLRLFSTLVDRDELRALGTVPLSADEWVVHVQQRSHGIPVEGAVGLALIGGDGVVRYARHSFVQLLQHPTQPRLSSVEAELIAVGAVEAEVVSNRFESRLVVHIGETARLVYRIEIDSESPWGHWAAFVDATNGEVVAVEELSLHEVGGVIELEVEPGCQGDTPVAVGMPSIEWGPSRFANDNGEFSSTENIATAEIKLDSPHFNLRNQAGSVAGPWSRPLTPNGFDQILIDVPLDQGTPFYHAHKVRNWLVGRLDTDNLQKQWSEEKVDLNINLNSTCNAFYNGTINFFQAGGGCNNTGRVASIVYHEYGHGVHDHSSPQRMDGQVGEGVADYMAATILNEPGIRGIRTCAEPFRTCENNFTYCSGGCDYGPGSGVHASGQVICAAWWELRKMMIERYGEDLGVATNDRIFLRFLTLVGNMSSSYEAAVAADDDDDGDPSNGTTHSCEINRAFADDTPGATPHFPDLVGLIPSAPSVVINHEAPGRIETDVAELEFFVGVDPGCAPDAQIGEVVLHYQADGGAEQTLVLQPQEETEEGVRFVAALEVTAPSTVVYYLQTTVGVDQFFYPYQGGNRSLRTYAGWPHFRQSVRVAQEETIFFSDFETDDGLLVPSTCLRSGRSCIDDEQTDWEWGPPDGLGGGPTTAASGERIWATDLDGQYDASRESYLELPPVDASEFANVRLQFWRTLLNADVARVEVNEQTVFEHRAGAFFWRDPIWTFQDIDISRFAAGEKDVRVRFVMTDAFDDSFELGGWHVDNMRVVGTRGDVAKKPGESPTEPGSPGVEKTRSDCSHTQGQSSGSAWGLVIVFLALIGRWRIKL